MDKRIALVTGANRGIGYAITKQLAALGIKVIAASRDSDKGKAATERLKASGGDIEYFKLDVTSDNDVESLRKYINDEYGAIDILINNAGILIDSSKQMTSIEQQILRNTMEVNFYGPLRLAQAFVPGMKDRHYGRIVNMSSGLGQLSDMGSGTPAYRVSKTAVNVLTRTLAAELAGTNVLINSMCPGWVRTDMGGMSAPRSPEQGADTAVWLATLEDGGASGGFFRDRKSIAW